MKLKNNQDGVAHLAAILVVVMLVVVSVVGWKVWESKKDNKVSNKPTKAVATKPLTIEQSKELVDSTLKTTASYVKRTTNVDQGEIDSVKSNLSTNLYGEMTDDMRYGLTHHDPFTCAQETTPSYTLSAVKSSEGTTPSITVNVKEDFDTPFNVFYIVDPALQKIVKIYCGR